MKNFFVRLFSCAALGVIIFSVGCRTVDEGPVIPTNPNQPPVITGKEPEHAPIPQKTVPEGDSSLSHKTPDERIDQPKG
jgi:hypothetical protein